MIKINKTLLIVPLVIGMTACGSKKSDERTATLTLKEYVDSVNAVNHVYTKENWMAIDQGYQERALRAEEGLAAMSEADKEALEASKQSYSDLRTKYQTELAKSQTVDYKVRLRNSLFEEGKVGEDMSFSFANATNLLSIYKSFVDVVEMNKNEYSREDWDEIKLLYEALDTRKNAVEKDLAGPDNRSIAALKIKFARIYSANRPTSKVRENADAKD